MKKKNKNRKLLFQVGLVMLPVFMILIALVSWVMYTTTVNGMLETQRGNMKNMLEDTYDSIVETSLTGSETADWFIEQWKSNPDILQQEITEEETKKYIEYIKENKDGINSIKYLEQLPQDIKRCFIKVKYQTVQQLLKVEADKHSYQSAFFIGLTDSDMGLVLCEYKEDGSEKQFGERYEIDKSEHPAIEKLQSGNDGKIEFEMSQDFPDKANYYLAFKPIVAGGKTIAAIGIAYNWDDLKKTLGSSLIMAYLLGIGGIVVAIVVILIIFYRRAVRPVTRIQKALVRYTEDKDSAKIVSDMLGISERNEIGYLADVISDMSLEIDRYTKENLRVQKDLYDAKVQIMVSQIRPHFMYNALTSIAMMCELDPMTAKKATIAFADYLRGNMDSLKQTRPVPFETELEHLKNYLYIEKLRFDYLLNIEYDIQATGFELPLLSIQPLVENAVKHGVGMKKGGGTVKISSVETDSAFEVIVSDDGVGFDVNAPKKDDGRSHVGMENTKRRLKEMCKADIVITSEVGKGTTARVIIPKKEGKANEDTVS
ncbi:histidine kinase [Ruminococcus sp. FC2018]|uniref:sensor histidine kinase n=1 Tax=Ruminococcus sp. FC2018 TaxID=1410617 RepID=UPI0018CC1DAB|nr:histidine kinase [Ruminococcus sp. FC2018]